MDIIFSFIEYEYAPDRGFIGPSDDRDFGGIYRPVLVVQEHDVRSALKFWL